eukprot:g13356.t1
MWEQPTRAIMKKNEWDADADYPSVKHACDVLRQVQDRAANYICRHAATDEARGQLRQALAARLGHQARGQDADEHVARLLLRLGGAAEGAGVPRDPDTGRQARRPNVHRQVQREAPQRRQPVDHTVHGRGRRPQWHHRPRRIQTVAHREVRIGLQAR